MTGNPGRAHRAQSVDPCNTLQLCANFGRPLAVVASLKVDMVASMEDLVTAEQVASSCQWLLRPPSPFNLTVQIGLPKANVNRTIQRQGLLRSAYVTRAQNPLCLNHQQRRLGTCGGSDGPARCRMRRAEPGWILLLAYALCGAALCIATIPRCPAPGAPHCPTSARNCLVGFPTRHDRTS